jgi:tetratricopeptide (TPR) repeat protein
MSQQNWADMPELPSWSVRGSLIAAFFIIAALVYGASLHNQFVRLDDGLLIYENQAIQHINPQTIKTVFTTYDPELYIPLTLISYQVDYLLGGIDPFLYHLQNLFWHTLNALLVAWLAYLLIKKEWIALFVGVLFLVHPLHTEAVAWAAARKDVLSTFFFLASTITYLYYRSEERQKYYIASLLLFALGLLAKVTVVTLPLVLLLIDDVLERPWNKKMFTDKLPYIALSVLFGVIALFGKREVLMSVAPWQLGLLASGSVSFLMSKLFLPMGLSVFYLYNGPLVPWNPFFVLSILSIVLALVIAFRYRKHTRWPWFGVLFFLITLAPTVTNNVKQVAFLGSDRYAYIPSIGIFFCLAWFVQQWIDGRDYKREQPALLLMSIVILLFGALAYRQSKTWRDSEALFAHALKINPDSYIAHTNLGNVYRKQDRTDDAEQEFLLAIQAKPNMESHVNLGALYTKLGRFDEAKTHFEKAIALNNSKAEPWLGLAALYAAQAKKDDVLRAYDQAVSRRPSYPMTYVNRGAFYKEQGDLEAALADFQKAIEVQPSFMQAHYNAAVVLATLNRTDEAKSAYEQAIYLQPWFIPARINLGVLLAAQGDTDGSRAQFKAILDYDHDNKAALQALEQLGVKD